MSGARRTVTRRRAIGVSCALVALAAAALAQQGRDAEASPSRGGAGVGSSGGESWEELLSPYPDAVGWVRVSGTRVDAPLMQASGDDPDFWLSHAPDGTPDREGSVYLDSRCSTSTQAAMAYGHHVGDTGRALSDVHGAFSQDAFDGIGGMTLYVRATGEERTLSPTLAMSVDKSYADIQRFGFADDDSLHGWLGGLLSQASASSGDAEALIAAATRAMTLVTCSSDTAGRRARTLLTFCEGGEAL